MARWNGQTLGPQAFSVAQHSLFVDAIALEIEPLLDRRAQLSVLLHDAAEYVIGDIISPFKAVLAGDYKAVENRLLAPIRLRFSLEPAPPQKLVDLAKKADRIAAFMRRRRWRVLRRQRSAEILRRAQSDAKDHGCCRQ